MASDLPRLDADAIADTRDALHAYSQLIGTWLKALRPKRKHWWHASLRPSLTGLTTGVVHAATPFELELDFLASQLYVRTATNALSHSIHGQAAAEMASYLDLALVEAGIPAAKAPDDQGRGITTYPGYSTTESRRLQRALAFVVAELEAFRADIREETSPIQVWPHHFDLSMIWLPGPKIPGKDLSNEEDADKQMNFGFVFGDETIAEPYFYVTAYPLPDALPSIKLPAGATWRSDGFSGAVALYRDIANRNDPGACLQAMWLALYEAGRQYLASAHG